MRKKSITYKKFNEELTDKQIDLLFVGFSEFIDTNYPQEFKLVLNGVILEKKDGTFLVGKNEATRLVVDDCRTMLERGIELLDIEIDVFFLVIWRSMHDLMLKQTDPVFTKIAFDRLKRVCDGERNEMLN